MQAETVYNVYQALPEPEKQRLYMMLVNDKNRGEALERENDGQLTDAECKDALITILTKQRADNVKKNKLRLV